MLNWLPRRTARRWLATKPQRTVLRLESLEAREVPAILIQLDYTYDNGFFANNPQAQATLQEVANELGNSISANLSALTPGGGNTWTATFFNPLTGTQAAIPNLSVGADTIKLFVGARPIAGSEAGFGGFGGYSVSGSQDWLNSVQTRGWGGFAPWGGSIAFDSTQNWYFGPSAGGLTPGQTDFYSVATHELGHVLGIGTAAGWSAQLSGNAFVGPNAQAVYGGPVPISADRDHWADGTAVGGRPAAMDPVLQMGQRVAWSALDAAALRDLGWAPAAAPAPALPPAPAPAPAPGPATPGFTRVPVAAARPVVFTGGADGTLAVYRLVGGALAPTGQTFTPFPGYHGALRVAAGDFTGDGVTDYAVTTGTVGPQAVVEVLSGLDGHVLVNQTAVFPGFRGGLFLAAGDIDGDGKAELAVSADAGAGPQVQTFAVAGGALVLQASFFAFDNPAYRGGARVAVGDINRDGFADLVVTTGGQAEGRVAVYTGADLRRGAATRLTGDFIPFAGYFGGLNAAAGDLDGDGFAELAVSPDRVGPAHVEVWSGAALSSGVYAPDLPLLASFYAFPPADGGGARLAMGDLDGTGRADLVAASGNPQNSAARVFTLADFQTGNLSGPTTYPLGTATVDGLYAADHTTPSNNTSTNQQPADTVTPARIDAPTSGTTTYTATSAPAPSGCTCPACLALAHLLKSAAPADSLVPMIPVK